VVGHNPGTNHFWIISDLDPKSRLVAVKISK